MRNERVKVFKLRRITGEERWEQAGKETQVRSIKVKSFEVIKNYR